MAGGAGAEAGRVAAALGVALTITIAAASARAQKPESEPGVAGESPDAEPPPDGADAAAPPLRPTSRDFAWIVNLSSSTKNLSVGASGCYLGYLQSQLAGDFLVTALINGFGHDDLDALRFSTSHTAGARLATGPFRLERRCGRRTKRSRHPDVVPGLGLFGVIEVDSLTQTFRNRDSGFYLGWSVGAFTSFVFSDITVTFVFRPFEQSAYYIGQIWDVTDFRFNNPTLEIELSYVLPW